jgi:uncharacterized lipoprotein YddW (UPF0748 family)
MRLTALFSLLIVQVATAVQPWKAVDLAPPEPPREFRGAWVASVANIDWPSSRELTVAQQQEELKAIVAAAAAHRLNALVVQIRTAGDALYAGSNEPWSEFLTGESGKAPDPAYDPLAMWIDECHAKGIELHAWFNPFRARHFDSKKPDAPSHVSNARPDLVIDYGKYKWMDPGAEEAQARAIEAVRDVVSRYDVDGVHIDDYFYPYPEKNVPFPDAPRFEAYAKAGGTLSLEDWRRDRINTFVRSLYENVKAIKPHVKVGVSPFGIWRPGHPAGVQGFDAYASLYADARHWLEQGWMDYCSPQLYWKIAAPKQPFAPLLDWWIAANTQGRVIAPGLNASKIDGDAGWEASEIVEQIRLVRTRPAASGVIQFSVKAITRNYKGLSPLLASQAYPTPALMPRFASCVDLVPPALESVEASLDKSLVLTWKPPAGERFVSIGVRRGEAWEWHVAPAAAGGIELDATNANAVALAPVARGGRLGPWRSMTP